MSQLIENYLKGLNAKPHLRLLAIIELYNVDNAVLTNCFGVFVGCKGKTDSDEDFKNLLWDNTANKPKWETKKPLWVIPLLKTNDELYELNFENKIIQDSYECEKALIKFYDKKPGSSDEWKNYYFLPEALNKPKELMIPCTSFNLNIEYGSVHHISENNEVLKSSSVWVIDKEVLSKSKRLFQLKGIKNEIKTQNNLFDEFEAWFGVRFEKSNGHPFFVIHNYEAGNGFDAPIHWREQGRVDDVVSFSLEGNSFSATSRWMGEDEYISTRISKKTLTENNQVGWLGHISEAEVAQNPKELNKFILFIAEKKILSGNIQKYLSNGSSNLNTYLFYFYKDDNVTENRTIICNITNTKNLITSWNKNTLEQAKAILKDKGSQPIGIVPQLEYFNLSSLTIKYENVNGNKANFSHVYLDKNLHTKLTFPLIKPTTYYSKKSRQDELVDSNNINIENALIQSAESNSNDNGSILALNIVADSTTTSNSIKDSTFLDGSFSLKLTNYKEKDQIIDKLQISLQLRNAQRPLFLWQWHEGIDKEDYIEFCYSINKFRLPIKEVKAFGNDLISKEKILAPSSVGAISEGYGERNEPTLIIPINGKNTGNGIEEQSTKYFLNLSESYNVAQDYRLEMQLEEKNPSGGKDTTSKVEAIVLNAAPQQIAKVKTGFLRSPITDDGIYILARKSNFSIDSGTWEIYTDKALEEGFKLTLPSQAIGEAYIKSNSNNEGEPKKDEIVDSRFSPPATLQIANEELDRHYVTPPWNLKNIWGEIGNSSPGLQLIKAQFELLYGLSAELENKEAFISELALKLGTLTNPPQNNIVWEESEVQKEAFRKTYLLYLQLYRAFQSRLSILEASSSDKFKSTKFVNGIKYFIRKKEDNSIEGAQLKWPIGGQVSPSGIDEKYHNKDGLAGGAFYPFESLGVYEELWREGIKKGSSSGEIENLAFTSLGGYGKQTARFSGDKTVIKSTTSLGRTHFHAVERIGRIGVFWNKAKHVIEYERTVAPTLQFKDDQPPLLGRPIVRKVREYIEILEPVRNFPDLDSSYQQSAGSIIGCNFKSIKIPVSSSWGRNVINNNNNNNKEIIGWEIPLWNKHANQEIYPFPQILLELLATKSSDVTSVLTQIENVQDIYFYTDVRSEIKFNDPSTGLLVKSVTIDAHTDNWPTVKYIDYTELPMVDLNKGTKPALGNTPELMDAILPAPLTILPGFERFSFKVKPSEVTSSVNGRYIENSEVNGKLRVVSMMRSKSNGNPNPEGNKPITTLQDEDPLPKLINSICFNEENILRKFTNGFQETNANLVSGTIPKNIEGYVSEIMEIVKFDETQIGAIRDGLCEKPFLKYLVIEKVWTFVPLTDPPTKPPTEAPINFELPTKLLWKKTIESADSFIGNIITNYDLLIAEASEQIIKGIQESDIAADIYIKNLYEKIDNQITSVQKIIEQFSFEISSVANEAIELIESRKNIIKDTFFNQIDSTLSNAKSSIENISTTTAVDDAKIKAKVLVSKAENLITVQIDQNNLLKTLNDKFNIDKKINELVRDVNDKIESLNVVGLDEFKKEAKAYIDELKTNLISFINDIKDLTDEIQNIVDTETGEIKNEIASIEKEIRTQLKAISQLISSTAFKDDLNQLYEDYKVEKHKFIENFQMKWNVFVDGKDADSSVNPPTPEIKGIKRNLQEQLIIGFSSILVNDDIALNSLYDYFKLVDDYIKDIVKGLSSFFNGLSENTTVNEYKKEFEKYIGYYEGYKELEEAIASGDPKKILEQANKFAEEINEDLGNFTGNLLNTYIEGKKTKETYNELNDAINNTLFNYRSVYDELIAPGLGFNRRTVAMLVNTDSNNVEQRLLITPVMTKFNQLNENLSALGIRIPSVSITDQFLAPAKEWGKEASKYFKESFLNNYDFTNILKGAGGINLERLIPGFKMPDELRNNIKITHGTDKQNLKAWAKAESNITIPERKELFAIGPVNVSLDAKASLIGNVKAEINADSKLTKENYGELNGSFIIGLQSTELMRFRDVKITCINDKYNFDLDPSRIEMSGLLKLISDATKNIPAESADEGKESSPFKVTILKEKYNETDIEIPYGVNATLDIPPITVGGGPTNITNLAFGGNFKMIAFDIEKKKLDFKLGLGFYMGKREAPFVFTAFIFGGGGFIDCNLEYAPSVSNSLSVEFAMSVQASAALAFNGGWIYGSVMVGMGIEVVYIKKAYGPGSNTNLIMFVQFIGHVCVIRIIHVFIVIRLDVAYDGNKMRGTGKIKASMKISRFFTIKVNKNYIHNF